MGYILAIYKFWWSTSKNKQVLLGLKKTNLFLRLSLAIFSPPPPAVSLAPPWTALSLLIGQPLIAFTYQHGSAY